MLKRTLIASTTAALALTAVAAFAYPPGGAARPTVAPGAWHRVEVARDLARLKAELQITTAQEGVWNGFAAALQQLRPARGPMLARTAATAGLVPAPEVFSRIARRSKEKAARAEKLAEAVSSLYKALTPVQRAILDTHLADVREMLHHRHDMRNGFRWRRVSPMAPGSPGGAN